MVVSLEEWIASGAHLSVQAHLLAADKSCATSIASFGELECQPDLPTENPSVTTNASPSQGSSSNGIIAGTVIVVLLIILAIIIAVVIILIIIVKKRKEKTTLDVDLHNLTSNE